MLYPIENRVREVKNLCGIWNFKIDRENVGLAEEWYLRPLAGTVPMAVPASYNDLVTDMADKEHVGYVWYETYFTVPASWDGKRVVLRFGSATHHATVWVDGREVVRHKGGFLPFEADITGLVNGGDVETHRLTVALSNVLNVKDFALMKWIGANSFRTSHYPYSEELLRLADREGFVVIGEAPAVGMCFWQEKKVFDGSRVNGETLAHHLDTLRDLYRRDKNHPCVVMWSVANEADTSEDGAAAYFKKVIDEMRSLDDTRPVTMVQTMGPAADKVSQWLDVICVNRYFAWYSDHGHTELIARQVFQKMEQWYEKFGKPMLVTEYGCDAVAGLHKFPPVAFSEEFQCEFLKQFHRGFDRLDFLVGEQVWAFADFQTKQGLTRVDGNKKGIFTRSRQPKMAAYLLRNRWNGVRESGPGGQNPER